MTEKLLVRNNTGTIFRLDKLKITLRPNQEIDLVEKMHKSVDDIKRDPEIMRELSYNNLWIVEEKKELPVVENTQLDGKLNEILSYLKSMPASQIVQGEQKSISDVSDVVQNNDDKMREDALMQILSRSNKNVEKKIDNIGKKKEVKDTDDFSGLIDI